MFRASADHLANTTDTGLQVVVVDEDVFHHLLDVFQSRQRFVTSAIVLIAGRNQTHNIASEMIYAPRGDESRKLRTGFVQGNLPVPVTRVQRGEIFHAWGNTGDDLARYAGRVRGTLDLLVQPVRSTVIRGSADDFLGTTTMGWHHVSDSPTGTFSMTPFDTIDESCASTASRH